MARLPGSLVGRHEAHQGSFARLIIFIFRLQARKAPQKSFVNPSLLQAYALRYPRLSGAREFRTADFY